MSRISTPRFDRRRPPSLAPTTRGGERSYSARPQCVPHGRRNSPAALESYVGMLGALAKGSLPRPDA